MNQIKRLAFSAALLSIIAFGASGQIPNASFESWTGDTLVGWWSNNVSPLYTTISNSTTAYAGSHAVRGDVVSFYTQVIQPTLQSGSDARGFASTLRPTSFTGYYEFFPAASSGDRFAVNVALYNGGVDGTPVAVAASALSATVSDRRILFSARQHSVRGILGGDGVEVGVTDGSPAGPKLSEPL
jgi:hypothetical protein